MMKNRWLGSFAAILFLILLGMLVFRSALFTSEVLMCTDDNIGVVAHRHTQLPDAFMHNWSDSPLLGSGSLSRPLNITNLLYWKLPPRVLINVIHFLYLTTGSVLLFFFMRRFGVHTVAAVLSSVGAYWAGSNLTLTYAGHIPKFAIMMLLPAALLCVSCIQKRRVLLPTVGLGALVALMFMEQQDFAVFATLPIAAYYLYRLFYLRVSAKRFIPAWILTVVVAVLLMSGAFLSGYQLSIKDQSAVEKPFAERWAFATQWSWPPEETIAFVAPGYTGWRSGEPEGPYWGRMGRSEGWEKTGQGFQNFKLENTYLGFIPVVFALFAVYVLIRRLHPSKRDDESVSFQYSLRGEILFWTAASVVALLLAFGKYFPLYRLFFMLPMVNAIRNPNKFLQIFQISLAVLSGWGLHVLLLHAREMPDTFKRALRLFFYILCGLCGVFLLWFLAGMFSSETTLLAQQGWGRMAETIVRNKTAAVGHALLILAVVCCFFFLVWSGRVRSSKALGLASSVLLILAGLDGILLSRHYIKTMPRSWIEPNAVTTALEENPQHERVATLSQGGFYNLWLTYLFPYYNISAFNFTQMPRMPEVYRGFLEAFRQDPLRMWQLSGVNNVLLPAQSWQQIVSMPQYKNMLKAKTGFQVQPVYGDNFTVMPVQELHRAQHVLASFITSQSGRYTLVGGVKSFGTPQQALQWMASRSYVPLQEIAVSEDAVTVEYTNSGCVGSAQVKSYKPATVVLKTQADKPAILRCADRYDPNWKARIDGKSCSVLRVDFCMIGIEIPAGTHTVELMYRPTVLPFYLQLIGYLLVVVIICIGLLAGKKHNATEAD